MLPRFLNGGDRRRRLLVHRVQASYVLVQLVWTFALLIAFAGLVFGPVIYELFEGTADAQQRAAGFFLLLHARVWPSLLGLTAALGSLIVVQSHRVIGPLVRFQAVFDAVSRGDLWVPSRIRSADYPQAEGRALTAMLESLRGRVEAAQHALAALDGMVGTRPEASAGSLATPLAQLHGALDYYRPGGSVAPVASVATPAPRPAATTGFTLLELLLVVSIIGVLAAVGVPGYLAALERARVTRAVGDIRAVQGTMQVHMLTVGCYPDSLAQVGLDAMRDPWGSPYEYGVQASGTGARAECPACNGSCLSRGQSRKDRNLVPINSDFDLYSRGRDRTSVGPLTASASQDDIVRASDGGFIGLAREY